MNARWYTIALSLLFANTMVSADSSEANEACMAVFNGTINEEECCESTLWYDKNESSECREDEEMSCDYYKCLIEEDELVVDDKISDEKVDGLLEQWVRENPKDQALVDRVRRNCLGGQYLELFDNSSKDVENCAPLNFYLCLYVNTLIECTSWKNSEQCMKLKGYVQTCKKAMDE